MREIAGDRPPRYGPWTILGAGNRPPRYGEKTSPFTTTIAGDRPPRYGCPGRLFRSFRSLMSIACASAKIPKVL